MPKLIRKDFIAGLNVLGNAVDDPDVTFYQNYVSSSKRNYAGYNDPEFDRLVDQQSREIDPDKRKNWPRTPTTSCRKGSAGRSSTICAPRPAGSRRSRASR